MDKKLIWKLAPAKPGDNDSNASRIRRWEEMNPGVKLSDLPDEQAVDALAWILVITPGEAEGYLEYLKASRL